LPRRQAKLVAIIRRSSKGEIAAQSTWWAPRSRKGATAIARGFGSKTILVVGGDGFQVPSRSSACSRTSSSSCWSRKRATDGRVREDRARRIVEPMLAG
jgi:hypothetical protein